MNIEAARQSEIRDSFKEGAVLIPAVMRLILAEDTEKMLAWGDNPHWVDMMLNKVGVNSMVSANRVRGIILAGRSRVWGSGQDNLDGLVLRVVKKSNSQGEIEYQRRHLMELTIKATIMAMVGGNREEYKNMLVLVKFMQETPEVLDELLGQLGVETDRAERNRIVDLLGSLSL